MLSASAIHWEERLWPKGYRRDIWMVVDSARNQRIFGMLLESRLEFSCLYSGTIHPALEVKAPYLVQLEHEDRRSRRFVDHAWGDHWGVFIKCDTNLDRLRRHLRKFLTVRDIKGNKLLFRYYDPRILRAYLPTCFADELRTFFGPVDRFWTEGDSPESLVEFGFDGNKLSRNEIPLLA